MVGFPAGEPPPELLAAARRGDLGGFILFRRNLGSVEAVAELTARLAAAFPPELPPWLGVDQEGGRVQRLGPPVLQLPPMRALGQLDDLALTREAAVLLGSQLAALGFNVDFAPVLDVDSNPGNPVIGDRSFGADPEQVGRHGAAFAAGLEQGGVAACGKHFPGHGDTEVDSHFALPKLAHGLERLEQVELRPFAATCSELSSVMTAHIVLDALDPARPATLSRAVLHGLLRERLGFAGVIFSDDLLMKAIADNFGVGEAACEAVAAGCDVLLICNEPATALQAHEALVLRAEREPAFALRLAQAAERSLALRRRRPPHALPPQAVMARVLALAPAALEERIAKALERHATAVT